MPLRLAGVFGPVVSPFRADGALDANAFARNVRAHLAAGLSGVVVAGSSGEAALLDDGERVGLIAAARAAGGPAMPLVAGVGAESTRQTIARVRAARDAGADGVLVVAPHYYGRRMDERALAAHFTAVADASPLPVLLYNIPVYAHLVLSPALVARMAAHENVVGMKDSAGDLAMLRGYLGSASDAFRVLTGHGGTLAEAIAMGVSGAILAVSLYAPRLTLAVHDTALAGDAERAAELQRALTPLARDVAAAYGPAGIKCAMNLVGLEGGLPRAPLLPCDGDEEARVRATVAELPNARAALDAAAV